MSKRAITYSRVSGDDTKKHGLNLKSQNDMTLEYCQQKGYQVITQLSESDKGASGYSLDLPQLNKIRDLAGQNAFDILVVRELDRLSRNLAKQLIIEQELESYGVEIEYVLADYEDSPEGRLNKHIKGVIAEYEREKIKERMVRGKKNKIRAGSVMTGVTRPYGYQIVKVNGYRTLVIDEDESAIVRLMFDWYCSGESIRAISHKLTDMGVPSLADTGSTVGKNIKKRAYGHWGETSIANILKYDTYATGLWKYGKTTLDKTGKRIKRHEDDPNIVTVEVPTIITMAQFEQAQKQREVNKNQSKRNRRHGVYLMARRVTCGHCNGAMHGQPCKSKLANGEIVEYFYYRCPACKKGRRTWHCDNKAGYKVEKIDNIAWDCIIDLFDNPSNFKQRLLGKLKEDEAAIQPFQNQLAITQDLITKHTNRLNELIANLNRIESINAKVDRAKEAIIKDMEQEEMTLDKLENEQANIKNQIASEKRLTYDDIDDLVELVKRLQNKVRLIKDFDDKRDLVERLDVRATMWLENKKRQCRIDCMVNSSILCVDTETYLLTGLNTQMEVSVNLSMVATV